MSTQPQLPEPEVLVPKVNRLRGASGGFVPRGYRKHRGEIDSAHRVEFLDELRQLALGGATDYEIAEHFKVSFVTLNLWRRNDEGVRNALAVAKEIADKRVEASLYQKATGYTFNSEEIKVIDNQIVRVPTKVHVPPDTTSAIFWLKNRDRENWRDQQNVDISGVIETKSDLREIAIAMIATLKAAMLGEDEPVKTIEGETNG